MEIEEIKAHLKYLSAKIGKMEIQRNTGKYISGNDLLHTKREFRRYAKLYFKLKND